MSSKRTSTDRWRPFYYSIFISNLFRGCLIAILFLARTNRANFIILRTCAISSIKSEEIYNSDDIGRYDRWIESDFSTVNSDRFCHSFSAMNGTNGANICK